jgi:hypothetical protein
MCVIIVRNPGITLPFEKIQSACKVNNHGWGLAVVDRGRIDLRRELDDDGNDPEVIAKALEDAKDNQVMLHLRYVTAGDKHLKNCHPFPVLTEARHGLDVVLAHNGTLYSYRNPNDGDSDTKHFVDEFVTPLLERTVLYSGKQHLLDDPFVKKLLNKEITTSSVVTLLDGNGNIHTINHDNGHDYEGWWASNTYSFNDDHRESKSTSHSCSFDAYVRGYDWEDDGYYQTPVKQQSSIAGNSDDTATIILPFESSDPDIMNDASYEDDAADIKKVLDMTPKTPSTALLRHILNEERKTFCKMVGISSLKEMTRFDPDDIAEFVNFYPEMTTLLIQDLLHELYLKDHKPIKQTVVPITHPANTNASTTDVSTVAH